MRQIQNAALPEWQLPPTHPPLAPRDRPDAFLRAIPDAALDICLILRNNPVAAPRDALQLAMRGFCTLPWPISHATLGPGRLDLRIDGAQLVFGSFPLPATAAFFRPDMAGASRATGRLGYLLSHHDMALRLRIAISATTEMLAAIRHLLLSLTRPKAVIALPQWLVLSLPEFERLSTEAPDQPLLAIPLPRRAPRHARLRPRDPDAKPPQQPTTEQPAARPRLFRRRQDGPDPECAPDPIETLLDDYHDTRLSRALRAEFRATANWNWIATRGSNHRLALLRGQTTRSEQASDMLVCDAVVLARRGWARPRLAPILLATLVALLPLTGQDRPVQTDMDPDRPGLILTAAPVYSA